MKHARNLPSQESQSRNQNVEEPDGEAASRQQELQAALDKLRESEQQYRALADAMPQIVWTANPDGYLDYYNARWFEYTGLTLEQTQGWGWQPVLHPEDVERCLRRWATSVKTGEDYEVEYRYRRASDGQYRWHLGRARPVRDEEGRIVKWFGTSTDIHDHKLFEEERTQLLAREQEARAHAEAAMERFKSLQMMTDAALSHLSLNDLLSELLNRIREMLKVDTVAILLLEKAGDELVAWAARGLEEEVEQGVRVPLGKGFAGTVAARQEPVVIEDLDHAEVFNPLLRQKGLRSMLGVPLMVEGHIVGIIHVGSLTLRHFTAEDTTLLQLVADRIALSIDHVRLYEIEREARAQAEDASRLKDEFLATLSHELRTPLTPIIGWTHMIRSGMLKSRDAAHALAIIDKNSQALTRLINDLLDMSAILSGKLHVEHLPVPLDTVVREAVETVRPQASKRNIQLEVAHRNWKEMIVVLGDKTRLVQVLWNMLNNAVKFSDEGGSVRVTCEADEKEARISVEDHGKGIIAEFMPYVFERFRQADSSKTRLYDGLGLGLALVKSFVESHGGSVEAESDGEGRGSRFTVHLPRLLVTAAQPGAGDEETQTSTPRARILVIEDAPDTLIMLGAALTARGYRATLCESAQEALRASESAWFDIVISDIGMPEMNGYELMRQLRTAGRLRHVPAIALSGYASKKDEDAAIAAGYDKHLPKPIDPNTLI
ncbi:MAG: ATP-binding protein, partial [Pyrinomonadaceae bacterium]